MLILSTSKEALMEPYSGSYRTRLTREERIRIRKLAKASGMTVTGYHDFLLRSELERSRGGNRNSAE